jgi:hypothetical protein
MKRAFPDSKLTTIGDLELEVQTTDCARYRDALHDLAPEVRHVAARARGWTDPDDTHRFEASFKIDPLFQTSALALVRRAGALVGLAGCVRNWQFGDASLVHLCSLSFAPAVQRRGLLRMLMAMLWSLCWRDPAFRAKAIAGHGYATAITQNPYLMSYFDHLFELYPSPDRAAPVEVVDIAQAVVDRFDPQVTLERDTLVLRGQATFFARHRPYGRDERMNAFCDRALRYDHGDVFVVVGRVVPARIEHVLARGHQDYPAAMALTERA